MGVGPKPIPIDKLDTPSLVKALHFMTQPEVQAAAKETGQGIKHVRTLLCDFSVICIKVRVDWAAIDLSKASLETCLAAKTCSYSAGQS